MQALTFFFAFVAVLALIGAAAWLVRRFAGNRLGANTNRGRMPRLAVIDAAAVDGRRRLVLVRRDNVEHLLMIGGPTDIVVEPNIVRAMPGRDQMQPRPAVGGPSRSRVSRRCPTPATGAMPISQRSDAFDHAEPQMPEPPPRPVRPSFADEARRAARRNAAAIRWPALRPSRSAAVRNLAPSRATPHRARMPSRRTDDAAQRARRCRAPKRAERSAERRHRRGPPPRAAAPPPRPLRRRAPIKISPRWRNGSKQHFAGRTGDTASRAAGRARTAACPRGLAAANLRSRRRSRQPSAEERI